MVVYAGEEKRGQFPLLMPEGIVTFSYKVASPALMGACAQRGIQLAFLTPRECFPARYLQGNLDGYPSFLWK